MSRRLGFRVDLRGCTGCKACQVACKDKHDLGAGVLWRRVVEIAGGGWTQADDIWRDESRTWFLSVACMHCEEPICAEVCPTQAMAKGADGVVAVETARCMGCQYCAWACPYGAPQFDGAAGVMTKCDLCRDRLAEQRAPACVAACPTRVLGVEDATQPSEGVAAVFPLPAADLTAPVCALTPHRETAPAEDDLYIGNREEIEPPARPGKAEWPLVIFTVLAQAAAGLCVLDAGLRLVFPTAVVPSGGVLGVAFALLALGGLVSVAHLGRAPAARYALANLRTSWLSREMLAVGALAGVTLLGFVLSRLGHTASPFPWAAAALGGFLVVAIARVYMLRTVPAWNSWATPATFGCTAAVLGAAGLALLLALQGDPAMGSALRTLGAVAALFTIVHLLVLTAHLRGLVRSTGAASDSAAAILGSRKPALALRVIFALFGAAVLLACTAPGRGAEHASAIGAGCALLLASDLIGRALFYASYRRTGL